MLRDSNALKNYDGPNPFSESQARAFGDTKASSEFFPTSGFWSYFNEQHEILLGTRGSGKTILLKMLSYSNLRRLEHDRAKELTQSRAFIGLYIPLHLEFMSSIRGKKCPDIEKREYFQFAFNCAAIESLLTELTALVEDFESDSKLRLIAESIIVERLCEMWFPDQALTLTSFKEISWRVKILYQQQAFWKDGEADCKSPIAGSLLSPITAVLPAISDCLNLDREVTNWLVCIDEAEFLTEPFLECINTVLRSEKRPLVIKIATLPYKHQTRKTLVNGVSVEPNGNDFNYRTVDLSWDSNDFTDLTNHLCRVRFSRCGIETGSLEQFLGVEGKDEWLDYFKLEMGPADTTEAAIMSGILTSISSKRRARYDINADSPSPTLRKEYFNRFSPVYYVRRMKAEDSKGNRTVGWFAGSGVVRRIADGNPRRFIQVMHDLVQTARERDLTPKNQHRVLTEFCHRTYQLSQGLPEYGNMVKEIVDSVGSLLSERVHGPEMVDSGCGFRVSNKLLESPPVLSALHLAIAYSHVHFEDGNLDEIDENSNLRLSFVYAVVYWLPMRKGESSVLRTVSNLTDSQVSALDPNALITSTESKRFTKSLQLGLFPE